MGVERFREWRGDLRDVPRRDDRDVGRRRVRRIRLRARRKKIERVPGCGAVIAREENDYGRVWVRTDAVFGEERRREGRRAGVRAVAGNERRREEETRRAFDQTRGCEESEEVIATARVDVSSHVCACVCVCVCVCVIII